MYVGPTVLDDTRTGWRDAAMMVCDADNGLWTSIEDIRLLIGWIVQRDGSQVSMSTHSRPQSLRPHFARIDPAICIRLVVYPLVVGFQPFTRLFILYGKR